MSIALFYGTTTGNTGDIAEKVNEILEDVELFDVADSPVSILENYQKIIFAIPTWDYGEIQEDWQEIWDEVAETDFTGKTVAFIGLGDQYGYAEWFLDAMGLLHDIVVAKGATVVGHWPVEGYEFDESKALTPDKKSFVGLGIDEDCQNELTDERISTWCLQIAEDLYD